MEGRKHHQTLSRKSAQQQQTDTQHTLSTADVHICYLCRSSVASSKNIRERSRKREFLHKQYFIPWKEQKSERLMKKTLYMLMQKKHFPFKNNGQMIGGHRHQIVEWNDEMTDNDENAKWKNLIIINIALSIFCLMTMTNAFVCLSLLPYIYTKPYFFAKTITCF